MKFKTLLLLAFGLMLFSNILSKSYAIAGGLDVVWDFGIEQLRKVIPGSSQTLDGLTSSMIELKVGLALPKSIANSLSGIFNMAYGELSLTSFKTSNVMYQNFMKLAISIFLLTAIYQMIMMFYSGSNYIDFIKEFILSLCKPIIYVLGISFAVLLLNSFIKGFETGDMSAFLNGEMDKYYNFALKRQESNWEGKTLLNLGIDLATLPQKTMLKFTIFGWAVDLADSAKQFNFFAIILSWVNLIFGIVNWFVIWVAQVFIGICFMISPLIAVCGMFEWGKQWQANFWSFFLDAWVTIFSFHFIFFFLKLTFLKLENANDLNLGYMVMTSAVLFLVPVIMLKFRSLFTISYYQAHYTENTLNRGVGSAVSTANNVVQNTTSTISSTISNSANMWK